METKPEFLSQFGGGVIEFFCDTIKARETRPKKDKICKLDKVIVMENVFNNVILLKEVTHIYTS